MRLMAQSFAIVKKEVKGEFRTRYALSSLLLFIVITISTIAFTIADEKLSNELAAALLWIAFFFGAMTGLSRTFVAEEERGTSLLLKLSTIPTSVYLGKLHYTILLSLLLNCAGSILFMIFIPGKIIGNPLLFWISVFTLSICMASVITSIAAIIAKAHSKGALFPVLSFPLLLPPALLGSEVLSMSFYGAELSQAFSPITVLISYAGVMIAVSTMLFDFIWND